MNNRENDDELERMRARARRGGVRQGGGSYQRPAQSVRERRSTRQSYDGRDEYDEEYYYGEEYGVEGDRQVDFPMEDYLDDEPPVPSRRLRSSHGSSGSQEGARHSPREAGRHRAGNPARREAPPPIRTGPGRHRLFQGIRDAQDTGGRIRWKGAEHPPDGSRDKWQNDVKKADGRGSFCSFWLYS